MKFHAPVLSGRSEVIKLFLDGEHTGCWQYALVKTVPFEAMASRFGVMVFGELYNPSSGLEHQETGGWKKWMRVVGGERDKRRAREKEGLLVSIHT